MSHVTRMNEQMSHVISMNESCHAPLSYTKHDSFTFVRVTQMSRVGASTLPFRCGGCTESGRTLLVVSPE